VVGFFERNKFIQKQKPPQGGFCEPAGTRTQGPYIKSVLLYQLSYEFNPFFVGSAKIGLPLVTPNFSFFFFMQCKVFIHSYETTSVIFVANTLYAF
jgi:hypothetical protein